MGKKKERLSEDERITKLEVLTEQLLMDLEQFLELPEPIHPGIPYIVNNYQFGERPLAVEDIARGGPAFITRTGVVLTNCTAYRVWRNQTGGPKDRTIGVYPPVRTRFTDTAVITVFVAPDGHTSAPTAAMSPTPIGRDGDSVGKSVPVGSAVFVHLGGRPRNQTADITEEP